MRTVSNDDLTTEQAKQALAALSNAVAALEYLENRADYVALMRGLHDHAEKCLYNAARMAMTDIAAPSFLAAIAAGAPAYALSIGIAPDGLPAIYVSYDGDAITDPALSPCGRFPVAADFYGLTPEAARIISTAYNGARGL